MKFSVGKILLDHKEIREGDRKFSLAIAIFNYFLLFITALALYYTVCVLYTDMKASEVLDFCKELSSLYIWGAGAVLTIYSGANVAGTFGKDKPPMPAPPPNDPNDLKG